MRVLVCGATGCVGSAVVNALRSRGHTPVRGARGLAEGRDSLGVDFMRPCAPAVWRERLLAARVDAVVNCVGILMGSRGQSFERVHRDGPVELFEGAAQAAHVRRTPYLLSKRMADDALAALPLDGAVLRPSLVFGPGSQSAALFATLASLPVISLPGRGDQRVQPIHVFELAEAVVRLVEHETPCRGVYTLGGSQPLDYREMLAQYRRALGLGEALWLPVPMPLMRLGAMLAARLPQKVFSRDTIEMLERGSVPPVNDAPRLLGRAPSSLQHGLSITPPSPVLDLRVRLPAPLEWALRIALAFMWLYTAAVSALLPQASGVLQLLARCGFAGDLGVAALAASCTLNTVLGVLVLRRTGPWAWPLQIGAVLGYTLTAAWNMPELAIDHCGPLAKNVPVLALLMLLWLAQPPRRAAARARSRHPGPPEAVPGTTTTPARPAARVSA